MYGSNLQTAELQRPGNCQQRKTDLNLEIPAPHDSNWKTTPDRLLLADTGS
jgi:hypothetical protein